MSNTAKNLKRPTLFERHELFYNDQIISAIASDHVAQIGVIDKSITLIKIFSTCPHLLHLSQLHASSYLNRIINSDWKKSLAKIRDEFNSSIDQINDDTKALQAIRIYKNQSYYVISLSELLGLISIEESCRLLSLIAEQAIQKTVSYLLRKKGFKTTCDCRWVILAMGKLGATELNYSSDLDLICLHSTDTKNTDNLFVELSQRLIFMLSSSTKDGNGWRIDMRLRPNPSSTAISLNINTAIIYYESIARTWERAAFVRARPIAGDKQLGKEFLSKIEPFIWRSTLDYSVIDDLQNWLRHLPIPNDYLGYDVKLGAFGIRHVELITHILQLLGGGRNLKFRTHNTKSALIALEDSGWISSGKSDSLINCYYAWRRIEHSIQYQRDTHTHKLPRTEDEFNVFACLMGYRDGSDLRGALNDLQIFTEKSASHPILDAMISKHGKANANVTSVTLPQDPELIQEWISQLGFENEKAIFGTLQAWLNGSIAATSSERAKFYLARLLPKMLPEIAKADYPNAAFAAFQDIISGLPAGVQIFALLENNPSLVGLLSNILVKAPRLTEILRYNSYLLDDLLEYQFFNELPDKIKVKKILEDEIKHISVEQALDVIRKRNKSWQFQADIHLLEAITNSSEIAHFRSKIASECLKQTTYIALNDFVIRHGKIKSNFEIIALGRLATQNLTAQSDLDLILLYDGSLESVSDGPKPLGISSYFIRLTQLINSWMNLKTAHGKLYELDLRLRPDGNAGPLALNNERFSSYYESEAWIWEFFALRDARTLLNETSLSNNISNKLKILRSQNFTIAELIMAFREIQNKRREQNYPFWNLKQHHGGLLDCSMACYIIEKSEKNYPLIFKRLNQIYFRFDCLIQELSTRLISHYKNELPERVIYFIAIQLGHKSADFLKLKIQNDFAFVSKILFILLDYKKDK